MHEVYYNMFKRKSDIDYIAYQLKYANIKNARMPLTATLMGNSINGMNGSMYYTDMYTKTTFMVIYM